MLNDNEQYLGFALPPSSTPPAPTINYDLQITKQYPGLAFAGSEINSQYAEIRTVAGDLWLVSNASYATGAWTQLNPAIASYATVLTSAGPANRLYAPAVASSPITWQTIYQIDALGALVKSPAAFTTNAEIAIQDLPIWNAAGALMTAWQLNVTDLSSAPASKLLDLQVGGTSVFSVLKTGAVNFSGTAAQVANGSTTLPGGVTFKWGQVSGVPADGSAAAALVFPTAFGTQCLQLVSTIDTGSASVTGPLGLEQFSQGATGAQLYVKGGAASSTVTVRYFAIGF